MDNDTLRVLGAAALAPIVGGSVRYLVAKYREKHAMRDAERRRVAEERAGQFGQRLARIVRRLSGRTPRRP